MAEPRPSRSGLAVAARSTGVLIPLANFQQLALLDDVWTGRLEAAQAPAAPEPDFEGLLVLADQMKLALGATAEAARELRVLLDELGNRDPQRVMRDLGRSSPETGQLLQKVLRDTGERSPTDLFIGGCRFIEGNTGAERRVLLRKRAALSRGQLPDPDLRPPYRCALTIVTIGCGYTLAAAGAVSVVGAPIAIVLGFVAGSGTLTAAWKKSGCRKTWKKLKKAAAFEEAASRV